MDIVSRHQDNQKRREQCLEYIKNQNDIRARSTLYKMYTPIGKKWSLLDSEFVNCRRIEKLTHKYTELEREYTELVTNFEQWATMALLMY